MQARFVFLSAVLAASAALAQTTPPAKPPLVQDSPDLPGRKNQRVEHIHVEDNAVSIDEIRYGGQTQAITVKPKANMPEYEIQPMDLARSRPADQRDRDSGSSGKRVWNLLHF